MSCNHTIRFSVNGCCTQTIELVDNCPLSIEQIVDGLNGGREHGNIYTSVQEGADLILVDDHGKTTVLGQIVESDMDASYDEFEEVA